VLVLPWCKLRARIPTTGIARATHRRMEDKESMGIAVAVRIVRLLTTGRAPVTGTVARPGARMRDAVSIEGRMGRRASRFVQAQHFREVG